MFIYFFLVIIGIWTLMLGGALCGWLVSSVINSLTKPRPVAKIRK